MPPAEQEDFSPAQQFKSNPFMHFVQASAFSVPLAEKFFDVIFTRGLHAARDRFTPRFAHRHSAEEILKWYADAGFEASTVLDWRFLATIRSDT
jgi:hypothetical protein